MRKTTKTCRKLKEYCKPNRSKKMPEDQHEKKLIPKHYTTMWIKTNRRDSNVYFKFLFSGSIDEFVVKLVVQAHHFPALALEWQVLEPLIPGAWRTSPFGWGITYLKCSLLKIRREKLEVPPSSLSLHRTNMETWCSSFPWTGRVLLRFRVGNERSCFRHISIITFPFFLVPVTFPVTFF